MSRPVINVTPLIDVLLVLLIIFMCVAPLKPSAFKARLPSDPDNNRVETNPESLVVVVRPDGSIALNNEASLGDPDNTAALVERLRSAFAGRSATPTVRCAVRLTTRNARPIGAGRTRFMLGP